MKTKQIRRNNGTTCFSSKEIKNPKIKYNKKNVSD